MAGFALIVWHVAREFEGLSTALALVGVWLGGRVFIAARAAALSLFESPDLPAFALLPIDRDTVFRNQLRWVLLHDWMWGLFELMAGFLVLSIHFRLSVAALPGVVPIVILSWLAMLSLAALVLLHGHRIPCRMICGSIIGCLALLFVDGVYFGGVTGERILQWLARNADLVILALPTAWAPALFELCVSTPSWITILYAVPCSALVMLLPSTVTTLRARCRFVDVVREEAHDLRPPDWPAPRIRPDGSPGGVGLSEIEEIVETRKFLESPPWIGGRLERLLWRWFTPRERSLAEWVIWRVYGWFYDANRFDLMRPVDS